MKVLDVGCGSNPMPYATVVCDKFPHENRHRQRDLETDGKEFVVADITALPFADKEFDYVHCSHVLEHCEDPAQAARELERVGKAGEVVVPSIFWEAIARKRTPESQLGHLWTGVRHRQFGMLLFPCRSTEEGEYIRVLEEFGLWEDPPEAGYGTEIRQGWGFGEWPKDHLGIAIVSHTGDGWRADAI